MSATAARIVMGVSSGSSTLAAEVKTPIPGPNAACAMSTGPTAAERIFARASGSVARNFAMNSRRVMAGALLERFRHTRTMDEARAFEPCPLILLAFSVRIGHVPLTE